MEIHSTVLYIWTKESTVRSTLFAFLFYARLPVYIYIGISMPISVSVSPSFSHLHCLSVCLCLSLSPWPVWSVIEGAVFTWPIGMEGTLCALWRQIALLAPPSLYLSFTSLLLLLLLLSSNSAHLLTTLLVSPLHHDFQLPFYPLSYSTILSFSAPPTGLKFIPSCGFKIFKCMCVLFVTCNKGHVRWEREYKPLRCSAKFPPKMNTTFTCSKILDEQPSVIISQCVWGTAAMRLWKDYTINYSISLLVRLLSVGLPVRPSKDSGWV